MDALEIQKAQRKAQVENGIFSEIFIIDPTGAKIEIKGIFDEPYTSENRDTGQVRQQMLKPRILLNEIPDGIKFKETKISVRGETYTMQKPDRDAEGIPVVWLI